MRRYLTLLLMPIFCLAGCGEPKITKMNRMHAVSAMGTVHVHGAVTGIGKALTQLKVGDTEYTSLTLKDETGDYTFYFLPSAHSRQPAEGDNVKMDVKLVVLDSSFAGGGRAPIIERFEFQ